MFLIRIIPFSVFDWARYWKKTLSHFSHAYDSEMSEPYLIQHALEDSTQIWFNTLFKILDLGWFSLQAIWRSEKYCISICCKGWRFQKKPFISCTDLYWVILIVCRWSPSCHNALLLHKQCIIVQYPGNFLLCSFRDASLTWAFTLHFSNNNTIIIHLLLFLRQRMLLCFNIWKHNCW